MFFKGFIEVFHKVCFVKTGSEFVYQKLKPHQIDIENVKTIMREFNTIINCLDSLNEETLLVAIIFANLKH
jgi:hypothetical protein